MRVLYFSTDLGPHDQRFLAALAKTRHDVHFLRLTRTAGHAPHGALPSRIRCVDWEGIGGRFRWWDAPRLAAALRTIVLKLKPDVIHAGPIQTCAFVSALAGVRPLLCMSWGYDLMQDAERNAVWRWATRYTLRRSSFFVSDAEVTRARAVAYGMPIDRTAVFPWGVDLRRFRPSSRPRSPGRSETTAGGSKERSARKLKSGRFVLLCNRSWEERYGVDVLARAFVQVAPRLPGLSLILVGSGTQERMIRRILEAGAVTDRVLFAGRVPPAQIQHWYHRADLFISPSHVDGSSVSLMEALASGTPTLVSDIPANREWVRDNLNGWLFRDGDAEELAQRISWIATHESARLRISRAARKTAEAKANWDRNFEVLLRAYDQAVAGAHS